MAITMAQIKELKQAETLRYSVGLATVKSIFEFQDDDGRPVLGAKVQMGDSTVTIMGERGEIDKLRPFEGKFVMMDGVLDTELKKNGLKVSFKVGEISEVK